MTAAVFGTLRTARDLEAAGFERRQAEALASTVRQARAADQDALATKAVIAGIESRLVGTLATKADPRAVPWFGRHPVGDFPRHLRNRRRQAASSTAGRRTRAVSAR